MHNWLISYTWAKPSARETVEAGEGKRAGIHTHTSNIIRLKTAPKHPADTVT